MIRPRGSQAPQPAPDPDFEAALDHIQGPLLGYIVSLLGGGADAHDILQETNLFLWEKRDDFEAGSSFKSWAFRVAYFKALAFRRDLQRRGKPGFREDVLHHLAARAEETLDAGCERLDALRVCLADLRPADRQLLLVRYTSSESLADFALRIGRSAPAVHTAVSRLRFALKLCVERRLRHRP